MEFTEEPDYSRDLKVIEENIFTENSCSIKNVINHPLRHLDNLKLEPIDTEDMDEIRTSDYYINTDLVQVKQENNIDENTLNSQILTDDPNEQVKQEKNTDKNQFSQISNDEHNELPRINDPRELDLFFRPCSSKQVNNASKRSKRTSPSFRKNHEYLCLVCKKRFKSLLLKKKHFNAHFAKNYVLCFRCGKVFFKKIEFSKHYFMHFTKLKDSIKETLKCSICSHHVSTKQKLNVHLLKHDLKSSQNKKFNCDTCLRSFRQKSDLNRHKRVHTGETPYSCTFCLKKFKRLSHLKFHILTHRNTPLFQCEICSEPFKIKRHYELHKAVHTTEKVYRCDICFKTFLKRNYVTKHYRTHTQETPFECTICFKQFRYSNSLYRHKFTHDSEAKTFPCTICSKEFRHSVSLKKHLRTHCLQKFRCEACSKEFTTSDGLQVHVCKAFKLFECEICKKTFSLASRLKRHSIVHTRVRSDAKATKTS